MKLLLAGLLLLTALVAGAAAPKGWIIAGSAPADYDFGLEESQAGDSHRSAFIKAKPSASATGFGTLMQTFAADDYRGNRWRLSGRMRSASAAKAQMWMRVDGQEQKVLAFDNMNDRPVTGNTAWKRYEIVLDVPEGSVAVAFGFFLAGPGQVWANDFKLERVPQTTPVTGNLAPQARAPTNLNFED